jgi:hypothetical protein
VLAGRQERKIYGIDLWRRGYAPELILSVGRFEWRRFYRLGLSCDGGLRSLVDRTPPVTRHFFVRLRGDEAACSPVRRGRLGTLREGRALAEQLSAARPRSLMVVSSPMHLRRVALVFRRAFRGSGVLLSFVGVPDQPSQEAAPASEIWSEFRKYVAYALLLPIIPKSILWPGGK